jgi:hypothetical protein
MNEAEDQLYILVDNQETGPFSLQDLGQMVENGEIPPDTLYTAPGMSGWEPLSSAVPVKLDAKPGRIAGPPCCAQD